MPIRKRPYAGTTRLLLRLMSMILALGVLAAPLLVVATSGSFTLSALFTSIRVAGLLTFSLLFVSIVSGAFRPFFNRIFNPRNFQRWHIASGVLAFALGLSHALMTPFFGLAGFNLYIVFIGSGVLALLILTGTVAFLRRDFKASWRWIHRINYLLFGLIFAHAVILGFDFKNGVILRVLSGIYAGVVVIAFIYRYLTLRALEIAAAKGRNA